MAYANAQIASLIEATARLSALVEPNHAENQDNAAQLATSSLLGAGQEDPAIQGQPGADEPSDHDGDGLDKKVSDAYMAARAFVEHVRSIGGAMPLVGDGRSFCGMI